MGISAERSSGFKSTLYPLLSYFQSTDGSEYSLVFKDGSETEK